MDLDRSLEDRIASRPSRGHTRSRRGDRSRDSYPRDGVKKPSYRDPGRDIDKDWVHDRYEDDRFALRQDTERTRRDRWSPERTSRRDNASKIRVDNLHYDLTERDVRGLFARIGPVLSAEVLYDRSDRSRGIAYVVYENERDARQAIREFDGANAYGQPITLSFVSPGTGPANRGGAAPGAGRSLFERIEGAQQDGAGLTRGSRRPVSERIDRYVPGEDPSRSPPRRRGAGGRRPGGARDNPGRRPRRSKDDEAKPTVKGRPRKTVDELDAEMADYFNAAAENGDAGKPEADAGTESAAQGSGAAGDGIGDADIEMVE